MMLHEGRMNVINEWQVSGIHFNTHNVQIRVVKQSTKEGHEKLPDTQLTL